jgi:hypothetical protein
MATRGDLFNRIKVVRAISPAAAVTDNTPFVTQILDTDGFDSATLALQLGSIADADVTFTVLVEDGDQANLSDAAAVADQYLLGTEAGAQFLFSDDNKTVKIGYKGPKRYLRVTITPANNSGNIFLSGMWILGHPKRANQTAQIV